ncbi:MAG TPA: nucleotidyltransferase domain-containing protein [Kofleriaceae bacterium]|nr:nucleotidyltransferase domain-containing protein [Kofleriaceae bacterium]
MVAELLPRFAPTPSSVAEIARQLPAGEQAQLQWFPDALRAGFIEPLANARHGELHARVDERMVDAVRIVLQLAESIGVLRERIELDPLTRGLEREEPRRACHDLIRQHVEPIAPAASDDLREAYEWLREISSTISITLHTAPREGHKTLSDEEIQRALVGEARPFFRGLLLAIGALDLLERDRVPAAIAEWCQLALDELQFTANALRAAGAAVPSEVQIPGYTSAAWRERRAAQRDRRPPPLLDFTPRAAACPPGIIDHIARVLAPEQIWLFGSRARGTAGPESDWDLLVVVPNATAIPLDNDSWFALRDVRRQRVELVPIRRDEFEADRREFGSLAQVATTTGRLIYGC